jgi:hypothetical protein
MISILRITFPSLVFLAACEVSETAYYSQEAQVTVSGLDVTEEYGNVGGEVVSISGSGFGNDILGITVQFGNQNAKVLSIDDFTIMVLTPSGPISGGAVDVKVGNMQGQDSLVGGYSYIIPGMGLEGTADLSNQIAYVAISNDTLSCYGGIHSGIGGCESFAYTGETGIEGRSEGLEFAYPKQYTPFFGGKGGFSTQHDISWEKWSLSSDPFGVVSFDEENNVEDLRLDIGAVSLRNSDLSDAGSWCANVVSTAMFTYNGQDSYVPSADQSGNVAHPELADKGLMYPNSSVSPTGSFADYYGSNGQCYDGGKRYPLDELNFCQATEYETGATSLYEPEWPVGQNFFRSKNANGSLQGDLSIPVVLDIPGAGIDEQEIILPPYAVFTDSLTDQQIVFGSLDAACPSSDDNPATTADDAVFNFQWEPVIWDEACTDEAENAVCVPEGIGGVHSFVKVTVSYFSMSWMGGEGIPLTGTITVPDDYGYDEEEGVSNLELPTWVLYSMPSGISDYGYISSGAGFGSQDSWEGFGDPDFPEYGFVIVTLDRVTEYTIPSSISSGLVGQDISVDGDLVFAYSTGDMGFFNFDNPLDSADGCRDCIDNDGDGWTDAKDPDCQIGAAEENLTTDSTCNDGIDNDGDGLTDGYDNNCSDGNSGESADCSDNQDNDCDGWVDQADPDCQSGVFEGDPLDEDCDCDDEDCEVIPSYGEESCNDGIDNDGDGWTDKEDVACTVATDTECDVEEYDEELGENICIEAYSGGVCNDGIDNDGHGDIDSEDPFCQQMGASYCTDPDDDTCVGATESPTFGETTDCANGEDDDGDGYIDENDPECEISYAVESSPSFNIDNYPYLGDCYDLLDNDCDGFVDAADPGCLNEAGEPDGFMLDESAEGGEGDCNCGDGDDNDGDGWLDVDDPDCNGGEIGNESGFGTTACNDGDDNDGDGWIDASDIYCIRTDATSDNESPSYVGYCANGEDDDGDGWIDGDDIDCEYSLSISENNDTPSDFAPIPRCSNLIDDDGDGFTDNDDPDCVSGFSNNENVFCLDGVDNDSNGLIDGEDPECVAMDNESVDCSDGIDNDGDGDIDTDDADCVDGSDTDESQ